METPLSIFSDAGATERPWFEAKLRRARTMIALDPTSPKRESLVQTVRSPPSAATTGERWPAVWPPHPDCMLVAASPRHGGAMLRMDGRGEVGTLPLTSPLGERSARAQLEPGEGAL